MSELYNEYKQYLRLERNMAQNTLEAYLMDLKKLEDYLEKKVPGTPAERAKYEDLQAFIYDTFGTQSNWRTQARVIAGLHSFYRFLLYHRYRDDDPSELIETPRKEMHLPEVLSLDEINALVSAIDLSTPEGNRNRAIIEMLYGSGLRVSELVSLRLSDMYRAEGYMLIRGKGSKQRLVPISPEAEKWFDFWLQDRCHLNVNPNDIDIAFDVHVLQEAVAFCAEAGAEDVEIGLSAPASIASVRPLTGNDSRVAYVMPVRQLSA